MCVCAHMCVCVIVWDLFLMLLPIFVLSTDWLMHCIVVEYSIKVDRYDMIIA